MDADEAYYWVYAHHLDWGYYDHPPMVALFIRLGIDWLPAELGLRLVHVLAGTLTCYLLYDLLGRPKGKQGFLAALLIAALPMLQVYGFIATPDGPLLLFSALFLYHYKRFLTNPSWLQGLLLAIIMAALLYSKYHGLLLIVFTILPALPWLVRQPAAWGAVALGALLYLPHLYWQYAHDFPSFRYHLSGRDDPYEWRFTSGYILNQLLIFNPFLLYFYARAVIAKPLESATFMRACQWLLVATWAFFLYTTTKGRTEAQWTAMLSIPLIYLLWNAYLQHPQWEKWLWRISFFSFGLFLLARLLLVLPAAYLPFKKPFDAAPWVKALADEAKGRPVIFRNSYRDASHYRFYTNNAAAWTFTDTDYRLNQYDIWQDDLNYQGQEVLLAVHPPFSGKAAYRFEAPRKSLFLQAIPAWKTAKLAALSLRQALPDTLRRGQSIPIQVLAKQREQPKIWPSSTSPPSGWLLEMENELPLQLYAIFQYAGDGWLYFPLQPLATKRLQGTEEQLLYKGWLPIPTDLPATQLVFQLGIAYPDLPPLRGQSTLQTVVVID